MPRVAKKTSSTEEPVAIVVEEAAPAAEEPVVVVKKQRKTAEATKDGGLSYNEIKKLARTVLSLRSNKYCNHTVLQDLSDLNLDRAKGINEIIAMIVILQSFRKSDKVLKVQELNEMSVGKLRKTAKLLL